MVNKSNLSISKTVESVSLEFGNLDAVIPPYFTLLLAWHYYSHGWVTTPNITGHKITPLHFINTL